MFMAIMPFYLWGLTKLTQNNDKNRNLTLTKICSPNQAQNVSVRVIKIKSVDLN